MTRRRTGLNPFLILIAILLISVVTGCGKSSPAQTNGAHYQLTHNLPDLEYIISWEEMSARIPGLNDLNKYDKDEGYLGRGNVCGSFYLDSKSPAMWLIGRSVTLRSETSSSHMLGIYMHFFETDNELDEQIKSAEKQGIAVRRKGGGRTAFMEAKTSVQSEYMLVAGNQICLVIAETASLDETLFFDKEQLMELLPKIESKISSIEITALPWPRIPRR
ncbi:MAG: hypothetical protein K9N55_16625 [Phycisphaerae bacterium]|nr:hypothetical protein [Phycisphaerae bacterium]